MLAKSKALPAELAEIEKRMIYFYLYVLRWHFFGLRIEPIYRGKPNRETRRYLLTSERRV